MQSMRVQALILARGLRGVRCFISLGCRGVSGNQIALRAAPVSIASAITDKRRLAKNNYKYLPIRETSVAREQLSSSRF
jgi:hypothetical protein